MAFTQRTTLDDTTTPDDVVRYRPAAYLQIICKHPNYIMAADVADVFASATFMYVFESETESNEKERLNSRHRAVCEQHR